MAKKRKAKATCLGCGYLMGPQDRFCGNCRKRNPNVTVKAAAPVVTKSARTAPYAPVMNLQATRQQQAWREITASDNPDMRESLYAAYFGGGAA